FGYLHWYANIRVPQLPTNGQSDSLSTMNALPAEFVQASIGRVPTPMSTPSSQVSTPPSGRITSCMTRPRIGCLMVVLSQAHLARSRFNPIRSRPIVPLTPESSDLLLSVARGPVLRKWRTTRTGQSLQSRHLSNGQHHSLVTNPRSRILSICKFDL
ncbi:hypothetical protein V565_312950, partial [Rhizoctonia solani 123E]